MVVWFVGVILVQWVKLWVGLIAEGFIPHSGEVKMEAVQQEVNFDPRPSGLRTHRWCWAQDERGAVHFAARLVLEERTVKWLKTHVERWWAHLFHWGTITPTCLTWQSFPSGQSVSGTILLHLFSRPWRSCPLLSLPSFLLLMLLLFLGGRVSGGLRVTLIFGSWTTSRFWPETLMILPPLQRKVVESYTFDKKRIIVLQHSI